MENINLAVEQLNSDGGLAGTLLHDTVAARQLKMIISDIQSFSDGMSKTVDEINTLLEDINNTQGPINAAIYDTSIVNDLNRSMGNITTATEKFNILLDALEHNFLFRRYYKRLERNKTNPY